MFQIVVDFFDFWDLVDNEFRNVGVVGRDVDGADAEEAFDKVLFESEVGDAGDFECGDFFGKNADVGFDVRRTDDTARVAGGDVEEYADELEEYDCETNDEQRVRRP